MKKLIFLICVFYSVVTLAGGLAVKGKYRARGTAIRNLHMNKDDGNRYRNYLDHRFRFNAAFVANDLIVIKSDLDFMGNCSNYPGSSFGCMFGDTYANDVAVADASHPYNDTIFNRWVANGQENESIHVKRLWTEINTKYGLLSVGRQPDSWGHGIYANNGDGLWDNYGDTLDRIVFDMKIGSVLFSPYYGNFSDRELESTNDFYEMGFKLKYNMIDTKNVYGLYVALRSSRDEEHRLATYDLFTKHNFGPVRLDLEIVFQNGSLPGAGIDATGVLARLNGDVTKWFEPSLEFGSASGEGTDNPDYTTYAFNPDFRPALIMFAHEFNQAPFRLSNTVSGTTYNYPASVNDAMYLKPNLKFKFDTSKIDLSLIWAQQQSASKAFGYEVDFKYSYQNSENLYYGFDSGILLPGDKYKTNNQKLTYVIYAGVRAGIKF